MLPLPYLQQIHAVDSAVVWADSVVVWVVVWVDSVVVWADSVVEVHLEVVSVVVFH
jgi:hypothetical protein